MAVVAPPLWGYMADRTGRPRLMLGVAVLVSMPAFLLFGCTRTVVGALLVAAVFGLFYKPLIPLTDGLTFRYIRHHGGDYGAVRAGGSVSFLLCIAVLEVVGIAVTQTGNIILVAMAVVALMQGHSGHTYLFRHSCISYRPDRQTAT
jgi:PPP family 3-phenylpropionic acid transporter